MVVLLAVSGKDCRCDVCGNTKCMHAHVSTKWNVIVHYKGVSESQHHVVNEQAMKYLAFTEVCYGYTVKVADCY